MEKLNKIKVAGVEYEIGDSIKTIEIADSFSGDIISETIRQILIKPTGPLNEIIQVKDRLFCKHESRVVEHPLSHINYYVYHINLYELTTGIIYKYYYAAADKKPNTNEQPTYTTINDQNQRLFYTELTDTNMTIQEFVDSLPVSKLYDNSNTTKINGPIILSHKHSDKLYNTYLFNYNYNIKNHVYNKNRACIVNLLTGVMYETQDWNITFADLFGSGSYGNYYLESDYVSYGRKAHLRGSTSSAQTLPEYEQDNYNRIGEIWVTGDESNPKVHIWTEVDYEGCQWVELTGSSDYYNKSDIDNLLKNKALAATADAYSGSNTLDNRLFIHAMFSYCKAKNVGLESSENISSGVLFNGRYLVSIKTVEENIYKMYVSDLREHKYYEYAGQDNTGINTYPSFDSGVFDYKTEYSFQPKLTAGENITISEDNVISATGGSSDNFSGDYNDLTNKLIAGEGITIDKNNVISTSSGSSAGSQQGTLLATSTGATYNESTKQVKVTFDNYFDTESSSPLLIACKCYNQISTCVYTYFSGGWFSNKAVQNIIHLFSSNGGSSNATTSEPMPHSFRFYTGMNNPEMYIYPNSNYPNLLGNPITADIEVRVYKLPFTIASL